MQVDFVHAGFFKLDGGAMFGIVPKVMWEKKNAPDKSNLCQWAARCLLIRDKGRVILVDTGLGDKQDEKFRSHFHPHGEQSLVTSLAQLGVKPEDVTDVMLTHLHFDHVGGATRFNEAGEIVTTFPNATYWSNDAQWNSAMNPNAKEAASFLTENLAPLKASGQLDMLPIKPGKDLNWLPNVTLRPLYGHTEAMMMPMIDMGGGERFAYCADLIPSSAHVRAPWIIAYDIRPLITLEEKARFVEEVAVDGYTIGFEHDPVVASARLVKNARGRIEVIGN
ncbi:MAG: MBL fold metallo-hydrolase [Saprospiraceae bacterium]